jgi:mannose-1-phosphate guanylyltransferase
VSALPTPSRSRDCLSGIDVFVLAGGLGTRIRSVLGDTPKLLADIGGRPYLDHLLDWLRSFGARRIVLGLGHRAEAVTDHLRACPRNDLELVAVVEPRPLGTAGAIRFARAELVTDPVLVINGDSLADVDLGAVLACHRQAKALGTIACAHVADASRYGRVSVDRAGRIQGFVEKDAAFHGPARVSAGIYLLSAALLDAIAAADDSPSLEQVFADLAPGTLAAFAGDFAFIDIGTPESLAEAAAILDVFSRSQGQLESLS